AFTYPRASPAPETKSSPALPKGDSWKPESTMYAAVLLIARPIGTVFDSGGSSPTLYQDAAIDASVGPYTQKNLRPDAHLEATADGTLSPPLMISRSEGRSPEGKYARSDGGSLAIVMASFARTCTSSSPANRTFLSATYRDAPVEIAMKRSRTDASNE